MAEYIRNVNGEVLYQLYQEKQDNCDGYRLKRIKPAKFNGRIIMCGDRCGWMNSLAVSRAQKCGITNDFYINERAFIYDARIFNSIILDTSVRGAITSISDSIVSCGGGVTNARIQKSNIENSYIENSDCKRIESLYSIIRNASTVDESKLVKGTLNATDSITSYIFNSDIERSVINSSYITDITGIYLDVKDGCITSTYHLTTLHGIGSAGYRRSCTAFPNFDGNIRVHCGCWKGTLSEFRKRIFDVYGNEKDLPWNKIYKEYSCFADLIETHFSDIDVPSESLKAYKKTIAEMKNMSPKINVIYTDEEGRPL